MEKTIGEMIDELTICNLKMSKWNHSKIELRKLNPVPLEEIEKIDIQIMSTNEKRAALKRGIDEAIKKAVTTEKYDFIAEERTYKL